MTTKYFNVKQGITTGNILLDGITGNITANNANLGNTLTANFFVGSGNNLSNISGANVTGTVANANFAGFVTGNAQGNITSVGTLTSLIVTGNVTGGNLITTGSANVGTLAVTGTSNLGAVGNVTITGGSNGQFLSTNGSGGLSFVSVSTSSISNGTSNVNIPTVNGNVNITAAGTTTLVVTGTGANIAGNLDVTGNLTAGNITTAGSSGNITGANNISANTFTSTIAVGTAPFIVTSTTQVANLNVATAGAVTGAAQGNITSVGTLTSLLVSGNANVGNLTTPGVLSVTGNANVGNLGTAVLIATSTGSFGGNVSMNSFNITGLATPVNDTDAATKAYVDSTAQGLDPKASVVYATTTSIFGSGYTYNNGTSGVGATITSSTNGALSIDGATPVVSSRVLIKDEVGAFVNSTTQSAAFNGIYVVTQVGSGAAPFILTRSTDFDVGTEMPGAFTFVEQGTINADTGWVATVNSPVTVGTTQIIWSQFSSAGTYTAGTGLTLVGNQFNISNTAVTLGIYGNGDRVSTFTVNQQGQLTAASNTAITANAANLTGTILNATIVTSSLTTVGTLGNLTVSGNISAGNISAGAGSGGNITGANLVSANFFTGTLTTAAQPNITSVGTLTSLTVTGTVTGGNLTTAGAANVGSLNVTGTSNLGAVGNVTITGGSNGYYLQTNGSGALVWAAISAGTSIVNGNSTVSIPTANGNVNLTSAGNTTMVITGTGANVTGTFTASNNVTGAQLVSTIAIGTAPFIVTSTTQVANLNVATAGTVTTAAQGNITSVGSLTGLTVSNATGVVDFTTTANVTLGDVGNLHISGGTSGQVLRTNGSGGLSFITVSSSSISNGNSNVSIPAGDGNVNITAAGNTTLVVTGTGANIAGTLNVTGNITGGNISTVGTANVGTLIVTGATTFGNLTANYVALNNGLTSNRSNVVVTTNTVIDQFGPGTFRTAKYIISASGDDGYQSVETLLIHDGTTSYITIYGSICSNNTADIIELSSNINGVSGNVALYATGGGANLKVNMVSTYIKT